MHLSLQFNMHIWIWILLQISNVSTTLDELCILVGADLGNYFRRKCWLMLLLNNNQGLHGEIRSRWFTRQRMHHIHCLISREKLLVFFSPLLRKNHPTKHVVPGFYLCLLMHVMVTSLTVTEGFTQIETTLTLRWMPTYNGKFHVSIGTNWKKMKGSKHRCKKHHKKTNSSN